MKSFKVGLLVFFALLFFALAAVMGYAAWHAPEGHGFLMGFGAFLVFCVGSGAAEHAINSC